MSTNKQAHLSMVQATISRLANQGASVKRWYVIAWAALAAFFASQVSSAEDPADRWLLVLLATALGGAAWLLDSGYLRAERRFIEAYDQIRQLDEEEIDFRSALPPVGNRTRWLRVMFGSWAMVPFYPTLIVVHVVIIFAG